VAAANEVAAAPIKPLPTAPPENVEREEPPKVAANDALSPQQNTTQPKPETPVHDEKRDEPPKVAANNAAPPTQEIAEPKQEKPVSAKKQEVRSSRETEVAAAIPTARPVTPEVRRAEPAPAEGPEEEAAPTEPKAVPSSRTKKERVAKTKRDSERDVVRQTRSVDDDEEAATAPMPQLPRGRVRAKFIGVAADGNWMFELPSKKIVIVPAPPGG
jgi:hypothetical protein